MIRTTRIFAVLQIALIMASGFSASSFAGSGDAEAGKQKSTACTACHGADGNSPLDTFPKIAGQVPGYIISQLQNFKNKTRKNAVMENMVAGLSDQDMMDLDAYYASQEMSTGSISAGQEAAARVGETIYRSGIAAFNVPACMGCHGPTGSGITPNFPRLAGQYATYIETQLLAYKSGQRSNSIMQPIAFLLSEEQIKQLALYLSALN